MNSESNISNPHEISLKDLVERIKSGIRYLLSKWRILVLAAVLGGVMGLTYAYFRKPVYTATTTFVLESGENTGSLGQYAGLASMVGLDIGNSGGGIFQGDNILELYKSRTMIQKTLLSPLNSDSKHFLIESYIEFNRLSQKWGKDTKLNGISFHLPPGQSLSRLQDSIIGKIVEDINKNYLTVTKPDKKLSILKVDVNSDNEEFAKNFNDQIVKNVNDFYIQTKTKKSLQNVEILRQKTDSVRSVMNGAIFTAAAVADATPNLNPTRQLQRTAPVQRSQFNAEANKALLSELVKNLELSRIALRKETPLIQIVDSPIFPLDRTSKGYLKFPVLFGILAVFLSTVIFIVKKI
ncbi:Wzz/FepE/Etk N-terminal domain-containing protein [Pedobacter sp.]|jgi:hypothetical protein|uniref:Wzz/FepE/Etk N-terminal domain-containing protein n=1 Tax=Pedobacter sp. TaxID=1411316 RepID=UPI002D1201C4|nr:Wzz/FepE/Etk N-terminal domain-containing protein [Pedobacter sp.]HWW41757.1 Wzz/FepE/Etk N-terminal domain-containing protein [Pedobacter sp.]